MSDLNLPAPLAPYRNLTEKLLKKDCECDSDSSHPVMYAHGGDGGGDGPVTNRKAVKKKCPVDVATAGVVGLISLKQVAVRVPNEKVRAEMLAGIDRALTALIDDYCGTPPHPHWLGSQADVVTLVGNLGATAETYPDAAMREGILDVAARIAVTASATDAKGRGD
jgi:hypothetical protein